jgi:DinB family protein
LQPAAHALMQAGEELGAAAGLTSDELWATPGGAASVGYHLRHIAGSIDRLLTYAQGLPLDRRQHETLGAESRPGMPPDEGAVLVAEARAAIDRAMQVLRDTPVAVLLEPRTVGRKALPTTVLGLLFHIGEHTQRHAAQIITTAKVVRV